MTALDATDHGPQRSCLEIVDAIRLLGARPEADIEELWKRMVFNILVSNNDDHLRNHAFLHDGAGWRLSPVYDLNPFPVDVKPRVLSLAIDEADATASLETAPGVAVLFGIKPERARALAGQIGAVTSRWRDVGKRLGLSAAQLERMETACEHDDLRRALKLKPARPAAAVAKRAAKPKGPKAALSKGKRKAGTGKKKGARSRGPR